jgi:hypothetical protein
MKWTVIAAMVSWGIATGSFLAPARSAADAAPAAATGQGTVIGSVDVQYQASKSLLGKMSDSTRSRKWTVHIASADDKGVAYRVVERIEVKEGTPQTFELTLPAGAYRLVDAENALSGGLERQTVPIGATFRVLEGRVAYVGRLTIDVRSKIVAAIAGLEVVDNRDVDLALIREKRPDLAADAVTTELMAVPATPSP